MEQVGRGGMGAVYKARHIYLNKIRAIKIIHAALAVETEFSDRFIREARILSELNHPNLVRLYEFGTLEQGNFFMVMEFVHGENLLGRMRRKGRLSIEEAVRICRDFREDSLEVRMRCRIDAAQPRTRCLWPMRRRVVEIGGALRHEGACRLGPRLV